MLALPTLARGKLLRVTYNIHRPTQKGMRTAACLALLGLLGASPATTLAQSPSQPDEAAQEAAQEHFRLAEAHYQRGEFAEAAREFEASYAADARPRLLYNAYIAYRDLQDTENAARTLRQYLVEVPDIEADERAQLRRRLEALDGALARNAPMPAEPEPEPEPEPNPDEGVDTRVGASSVPETSRSYSPIGFIVAGSGLALGLAAVVTGVLSSSDHNLLSEQCDNGGCPDTPELRDAHSRGSTLAVTTDILWITGAAAVAAGVVLIFVLEGESSESAAGVSGSCTMDGCFGAVRGSF